jgi:beta-phosphoglucomutase
MIKGIIFDLDGVLVTTDEMHYRGWKRLAEDEGIEFDRCINQRQRGVSRMESLEVLLECSERVYTPEEKIEMASRKNDYYRGFLTELTEDDVLPGAREMLIELRRRGVKTAIGSSSRNAPTIMKLVGLEGMVDAVVDGNHIQASKPDPEVFLLAAEAIGLKPEECVVIEDATAGIEAGRRAGMPVFGIGTPESLPGVEHLAENLAGVTADELLSM